MVVSPLTLPELDVKLNKLYLLDLWVKLNDRIGPWLFYIGLSLMFFNLNYLWVTDNFPRGLNLFCYYTSLCGRGILCLRLLLMAVQHPRFVVGCTVVGLILFFTLALGKDYSLVTLLLVLVASRDSNIRVVLKIFLVAFILHLVSAFLFYKLGWSEDIVRHRWGFVGHSYGISNPGILAQKLMIILFIVLLFIKTKRWLVIGVSCVIGAVCILGITLRLSESIGLLLMPLLYVFFCRYKVSSCWLVLLPWGCLLASVVLAGWYVPSYGTNTFESRFSIPHLIYNRVGLSLFSQDCGLVGYKEAWDTGQQPLYLDSMYLRVFLQYGVMVGLGVMAFLSFFMFHIGKIGKPLLTAIAAVFIIEGVMEYIPLEIFKNFTLFYCLYTFKGLTSLSFRVFGIVGGLVVGAILFYLYAPWGSRPAFSHPYGRLGDIDPPEGFERITGSDSLFSSFLRNLPLTKLDTTPRYYDGTPNDTLQPYNYRLLNLPLLDENEQCADVCMRLRAEYLYFNRRFFDICFTDTRQKRLYYLYGNSRHSFNQYLKEVYAWANTESMKNSMPVRLLKDIQPGDVFVYDKDSRPSSRYGHAVLVADVAVDPKSGEKAILLIQGTTPASDIHVIRNLTNPDFSPWFLLDSTSYILDFGYAQYYPDELHYYK